MPLSDPVLRTTDSLVMLECMKSAAKVLQIHVNNQTRRRLQDVDEQLASLIAAIMCDRCQEVSNHVILPRTGVKRALVETLGEDTNCMQPLPPLCEFLTEPNKEGRLASWLKPGLGFVTTSLAEGCRILLEQVRTKAMRTISVARACNFRKALVAEFRDTCCDRQQETCLKFLGRKKPGSPSCTSCVVWVGRQHSILKMKADGTNVLSAGTFHFCVSTADVEESHISIIPPLKTTTIISGDEGDDDQKLCTVQLANLHQYAIFYRALAKLIRDSRGTSSADVSRQSDHYAKAPCFGTTHHPALRTWLGLPDQVGQKPTDVTPSSTLHDLLGAPGHRHKLIAVCLVSKLCYVFVVEHYAWGITL
jgi:hypothetical protein